MFRITRNRLLALAGVALTAATMFVAAAPAQAASGCHSAGFNRTVVTDVNQTGGYVYSTFPAYYCTAYQSAHLYSWVPGGGVYSTSRILNAGQSWFICQIVIDSSIKNPPVGSALNDYWLYTESDSHPADDSAYGWFPANKISGGGNYQAVPGLPICKQPKIPLSF